MEAEQKSLKMELAKILKRTRLMIENKQMIQDEVFALDDCPSYVVKCQGDVDGL